MDQPRFAYLVKISASENNNRFYRMIEQGNIFQIEMGRVGCTPVTMKRPINLWNTTYEKKIKEGYVDRGEFCDIKPKVVGKYRPIEDAAVKDLITQLMHYANKKLKENYQIEWSDVSMEMIATAQDILEKLGKAEDVKGFNNNLLALFNIIPRKMKDVMAMLAETPDDFEEILEREQHLLDVMRSKVVQEKRLSEKDDDGKRTIIESLGLDIRLCTNTEVEQIKSHLEARNSASFARAFRVKNRKTDQAFYDYMKTHGLTNRDIHYFYHGSRNQNYFGILTEGLLLNPKAPITGKMFGHGIYFAPSAKKSINYTSLSGSYWAGGHSDKAYLAVYKVLYNHPMDVHIWDNDMTRFDKYKIRPNDAVYAHKGISLLNDEVIVYREEQATLQYLIELKKEEV